MSPARGDTAWGNSAEVQGQHMHTRADTILVPGFFGARECAHELSQSPVVGSAMQPRPTLIPVGAWARLALWAWRRYVIASAPPSPVL